MAVTPLPASTARCLVITREGPRGRQQPLGWRAAPLGPIVYRTPTHVFVLAANGPHCLPCFLQAVGHDSAYVYNTQWLTRFGVVIDESTSCWEAALLGGILDRLAGGGRDKSVILALDRYHFDLEAIPWLRPRPCEPAHHLEVRPGALATALASVLIDDRVFTGRSSALGHFRNGVRPADFIRPATAIAGNRVLWDYESEVPAKVSGVKKLGPLRDDWSLHWGGHVGVYDESEAIGVLEGLERIAGYRPQVGALSWWGTPPVCPCGPCNPTPSG